MNSRVSGSHALIIPVVDDTTRVSGTDEQAINTVTDSSGDPITILNGSDSLNKKATDTTNTAGKVKADSSTRKRLYFSAGLGLHQLLPVDGQKSNPYNSAGRKNSLADYIPSVYFRVNKENKWFLQSEFRYAAPQYTREIIFDQKISDSTGFLKVSNSTVKKTFFHQLPVSFNYFVLPGLSLGAGATFNKFKSAIVQQDVYKRNGITDSLISAGIVDQKRADSNFVTSYMQLLLEAQFKWKQLSGGLRYSFGLQPYIKFRLPGGVQREEKSSAFQLFVRYELWRSKK